MDIHTLFNNLNTWYSLLTLSYLYFYYLISINRFAIFLTDLLFYYNYFIYSKESNKFEVLKYSFLMYSMNLMNF